MKVEHVTPVLRSRQQLQVYQTIDFEILQVYKTLTDSEPKYISALLLHYEAPEPPPMEKQY